MTIYIVIEEQNEDAFGSDKYIIGAYETEELAEKAISYGRDEEKTGFSYSIETEILVFEKK